MNDHYYDQKSDLRPIDIKTPLSSRQFLTICVFLSALTAFNSVTYSCDNTTGVPMGISFFPNIIMIPFVMGMWMIYMAARDKNRSIDSCYPGLSVISVALKVIHIIMWVCNGVLWLCTFIMIIASVLLPPERLDFVINSPLYRLSDVSGLSITGGQSVASHHIVTILIIMCVLLLLVCIGTLIINLSCFKYIRAFVDSLKASTQKSVPTARSARATAIWIAIWAFVYLLILPFTLPTADTSTVAIIVFAVIFLRAALYLTTMLLCCIFIKRHFIH